MAGKRKVTITIDEELVRALENAGNVSAQLNEAGWSLVERRQRAERLAVLLDRLDEQHGPLPDDPDEDARLERLLGGAA
jgi:DNA-binding transcriptional regulator YbjK